MSETIYARFEDARMAEKAVGALLDHGMEKDDVSLISGSADGEHAEKIDSKAKDGVTTTTGKDAASGAAKGTGAGLVLGAVAALASLFIPGFGLVTGGGALATAIAAAVGTTAAGAVAGGITGFLVDQGMDQPIAQKYEDAIKHGGALVALSVPSGKLMPADADMILTKYGSSEVNRTARFVPRA